MFTIMKLQIRLAISLFFILWAVGTAPSTAGPADRLPLIPLPVSVHRTGDSFTITRTTAIRALDRSLETEADFLARWIGARTRAEVRIIIGGAPTDNTITLESAVDSLLGPEGYHLSVTDRRINLRGSPAGIFYGEQTLRQLFTLTTGGKLEIPGLEITDYPRFRWRGLHLDVCRHFFPVEFLKKYVDLMSVYKMNTFHLHLTDDQGWRIEIRKYPRLMQVGGYRAGSMVGPYSAQKFDSLRYGGWYSQSQLRDLVSYAADRHVTIVPEIEMPGHALAALASYPALSCTGGPFEVGRAWGVYDDVFCPKKETFSFLEDVLSEVCDIFPGPYIHIGGDEVPKTRWKACAHCQALIKSEGLKNEDELQSYFIRQIGQFLTAKGKRSIGWDEILEGGLPPDAAVMSWRGTEGGTAAARMRHDVVMTPGGYCYFDYYQGNPATEPLAIGGYTTVEKVYSYDPVPSGLTPEEQSHILGAQGNVWTEYITTPRQVEYMAYPRTAALAEVDWTPESSRVYSDFQQRLIAGLPLLDSIGVNYSRALYEVTILPVPAGTGKVLAVELHSPFTSGGIRYTLDGSDPSASSTLYKTPIPVDHSVTIKAAYLEGDRMLSAITGQRFEISLSTGKPIRLAAPAHQNYPGHGPSTLVDGIRGDTARFGQNWLGFWGPDLDATIDLGAVTGFSRLRTSFVGAEASWIYPPRHLTVYAGNDSASMTMIGELDSMQIHRSGAVIALDLGTQSARFVRIVARNAGRIPEGKPGSGNSAWLFVDELAIEK